MQRTANNPATTPSDTTTEKSIKTALLFAVINLLVSPTYFISRSAGLLLSSAANAFTIYKLHELGKSRRPGANLLTSGLSIFSAYVPPEVNAKPMVVKNAYKNVINGGELVANELANMTVDYISNRPGRR